MIVNKKKVIAWYRIYNTSWFSTSNFTIFERKTNIIIILYTKLITKEEDYVSLHAQCVMMTDGESWTWLHLLPILTKVFKRRFFSFFIFYVIYTRVSSGFNTVTTFFAIIFVVFCLITKICADTDITTNGHGQCLESENNITGAVLNVVA